MKAVNGYIRASELGEFAYCRRAWKLASVGTGRRVGVARRLEAGERSHVRQGQGLHYLGRLQMWAGALLMIAALMACGAFLAWWQGF